MSMDSSGSSISSIGPAEATQLLKDLLNVGKARSAGSDTSTASLASHVKDVVDTNVSLGGNAESRTYSSGTEAEPTRASSSGELDPASFSSRGDRSDQSFGENQNQPMMSTANGQASIQELLKSITQQIITKQQVILTGDDTTSNFSVYGRDVDVIASVTSAAKEGTPGSNKVKINPVVNFDWESKHYLGNLVAVHRTGVHVAYVLRGKSGGIVRVLNKKTAERALLKGFTGRVVDIAFAHLNPIVLGAVDEQGNMFIYEILDTADGKLDTTLLLQVNRPPSTPLSENHRLIWCPYIPEDEESSGGNTTNTTTESSSEDVSKLLVLTHDSLAEMWNVDIVLKEYGCGPLMASEVEIGCLTINNHTLPIVDASFSPDGTALATASLDGYVKFFQVYMHDKSPPRCLHEWKPHNDKPLSCLFFLDDHKHPNPEVQFWKFAVTGADNNQELKVWSCESWTCLQTLRFVPPPDVPPDLQRIPCIKAEMDLSANYMLLSDITRRVLYVLQIYQDMENSRSHVNSISEFVLAQPCLSFAVVDASRRKLRPNTDSQQDQGDLTTGEVDYHEGDEVSPLVCGPDVGIVVKMYSVHTKAMQEMQIRFTAESATTEHSLRTASISSQEDGLRDRLSDMSMETQGSELDGMGPVSANNHSGGSVLSRHTEHAKDSPHSQPLLMTPDAFTSPRRIESSLPGDGVRNSGSSSNRSSLTQVTAMDEDQLRTPHGSVSVSQTQSHNQPSPVSSITLTPASSRDLSTNSPHLGTPTSVPLPPPTPGEEAALALNSRTSLPHSVTGTPTSPHTPPHSANRTQTLPPIPSGATSQDFLTSSPAHNQAQDFHPPVGRSDSEHASSEALDDLFHSRVSQRRSLHSTGSSSSTSLEVSEILEGAKKPGHDIPYEEPDDEVTTPRQAQIEGSERGAEADGEETESDSAVGVVHRERKAEGREDGDRPLGEEDEDDDMLVEDVQIHSRYDKRIWPLPPDVENVNMEAHRLAADAIQRAATLHLQHRDGAEGEEEPTEEEIPEEIEGDNAEDDIQLEEEKDMEHDYQHGYQRRSRPRSRPSSHEYHGHSSGGGEPMHGPRLSDAVGQLQTSLETMVQLLQAQQQEIEQLKGQLQQQKAAMATVSNLQSDITNLESALATRVVGALSEHSQSESERLQQVLGERESHEKQKHDQLVTVLSQTVNTVLSARMERTVKEEMRNTILPSVNNLLEPLKHQLHSELAQKLTATDALMKENITKLVRSKQILELLGQSVSSAVQGPVQAACRDVLIPAFDRSSQNIFQQLQQTFQQGTQEYIQQLESHLEAGRRRQEAARDPIVGQLQAMVDAFQKRDDSQVPVQRQLQQLTEQLQTTTAQLHATQAHVELSVQQAVGGLQKQVETQMRQIVQEEVSIIMRDQQASLSDQLMTAMRSSAMTPAPSPSPDPQAQKAQVLQLLRQGRLSTAFQQALSASDLSLVTFVCETVNPEQVFQQTPCPLQQPVLLSLIQQLSADLSSHSELKHKYLEEAVMNLDLSNAVTKEHSPAVLSQLCQQLSTHIFANPHDAMTRNLRMLLMATKSLTK